MRLLARLHCCYKALLASHSCTVSHYSARFGHHNFLRTALNVVLQMQKSIVDQVLKMNDYETGNLCLVLPRVVSKNQ